MPTSYHVHSKWSDGEAPIIEYIRAANDLPLDEIGFSDHYLVTPSGKDYDWAMPLGALDDYVADVQSAAGEARDGLIVRLGVEADFIPETVNTVGDVLQTQPFDYVIGSVHILDGFCIDCGGEDWEPLSVDERDDIIRGYWNRIRQMAESGLFDIAAHLDLTKKFDIRPTIDISSEISAALDAIAVSGMAVEINTAGWFMPVGEAYPDPSILRGCLRRDIPILITADAHTPANLTRGFDDAYRLAEEIGFTQTASYAGRRLMIRDA